jgi:hypothetical protein
VVRSIPKNIVPKDGKKQLLPWSSTISKFRQAEGFLDKLTPVHGVILWNPVIRYGIWKGNKMLRDFATVVMNSLDPELQYFTNFCLLEALLSTAW